MKRNFYIFMFILFGLISAQMSAYSNSTTTSREIALYKDPIQPQPRMPVLENFTASYDLGSLYISSTGYVGSVKVTIAGSNGFTITYYTSGTSVEGIDISGLVVGNYTLTITSSKNVYTGVFEL